MENTPVHTIQVTKSSKRNAGTREPMEHSGQLTTKLWHWWTLGSQCILSTQFFGNWLSRHL